MVTIGYKPCGHCGQLLPAKEFNRCSYSSTGLRSQCKSCMAEQRAASASARKAYRQRPEVREWYREYRKSRYVRDKLKAAARNATRKLSRQPCEKCGEPRAHAHHDDYGRPLDVRWLCTTHHAEWHKHNKPVCPEQEIAA